MTKGSSEESTATAAAAKAKANDGQDDVTPDNTKPSSSSGSVPLSENNNENVSNDSSGNIPLLSLTPESVYDFYVQELFPAILSSLPILMYRLWNDVLSWSLVAANQLYLFVMPTWMKESGGGSLLESNGTESSGTNLMMHLQLAEKDLGSMIHDMWEQAVQSSKHVNATIADFMINHFDKDKDGYISPIDLLGKLPATANIIIRQEAAAVESFWAWFSREWPLMDWKIGVFLWQTFGGILLIIAILSIMPGRLHTWSGKLLRWPILGLTYLLINVELVVYICIRLGIRLIETIVANPKHRMLRNKMAKEAESYQEWYQYAAELDNSQKRTIWQSTTTDETSYQYNWPLIQQLVKDMKDARIRKKDPMLALAVLQQCTRKNVGGIMNEDLFTKTYTGEPKFIVMEFIQEVTQTLYWVTDLTVKVEESLSATDQERKREKHISENYSSSSGSSSSTFYEQNLLKKSRREREKLWRSLVAFVTLDFSGEKDEEEKEQGSIKAYPESPKSVRTTASNISTASGSKQVHREQLLKFLKRARHAYGKTALCLSGGAMMGLYHIGHLKGLMETDCLPDIVSGCSAGSAFGAVVCTRTNDELHRDLDPEVIGPRLKCFNRSWFECLQSVRKTGNLFDGDNWLTMIKWFTLGDMTFEEAYQKTGRVLCIALAATAKKTPPILVNYITAPNVTIASAVVASAAVPGFVSPRHLQIKDPDGTVRIAGAETYFDGSIKHDIPTTGLSEMLNCHFFVACQCNPHIVPFFFNAKGGVGQPTRWSGGEKETSWRGGFLLAALEMYLKNDMRAKFVFLRDLDAAVSFTGTMMTQSFEGTTTIVPQVELRDFFTLFSDPSVYRLYHYLHVGRVAAYQHAAMIRCHYRISDALDECIERLEEEHEPLPQRKQDQHSTRKEVFGQYDSPKKTRPSRRSSFEVGDMQFDNSSSPNRDGSNRQCCCFKNDKCPKNQGHIPKIISPSVVRSHRRQWKEDVDSVSTSSDTGDSTLPIQFSNSDRTPLFHSHS